MKTEIMKFKPGNISVTLPAFNKIGGMIIDAALIALLCISSINSALFYIKPDYNKEILISFIIVFSFLLCINLKKHIKFFLLPAVYFLTLIYTAHAAGAPLKFVMSFRPVLRGFELIADMVINKVIGQFQLIDMDPIEDTLAAMPPVFSTDIFLIDLAVLLIFIYWASLKLGSGISALIPSVILACYGMCFGITPDTVSLLAVLAGIVTVLSLGTVKKHVGRLRLNWEVLRRFAVEMLAVTLLASICGLIFTKITKNALPDKLMNYSNEKKIDAADLIDELKYRAVKVKKTVSNAFQGNKDNEMLYEISDDLRQNYKITQEGISQLRLTMTEIPETALYLKGYAAGNYGDSSWKFDELPDNTFTTEFPSINRMYECILSDKTSYIGSRVTVNNLMNGSDMVFAPYFSYYDGYDKGRSNDECVYTKWEDYFAGFYYIKDESPVNLKNDNSMNSGAFLGYFIYCCNKNLGHDGVTPYDCYMADGFLTNRCVTVSFINELAAYWNSYYSDESGKAVDACAAENGENDGDGASAADFNGISYNISCKCGDKTKEISFKSFLDEFIKEYKMHISVNNQTYDNDDYEYMNYAYKTFENVSISIPKDVINEINMEIKLKIDSGGEELSYIRKAVIDSVRDFFLEHYTYSLINPRTPINKDFIEYFLSDMDTGSCTYFASAAVMLLRNFGIPARYVSGFAVSAADLKKSAYDSKNKDYVYDVTDKCSHAWVEYYDPQMGWIPLDFTPSYGENQNTAKEAETEKTAKSAAGNTQKTAAAKKDITEIPNKTEAKKITGNEKEAYRDYSVICIFTIILLGVIFMLLLFIHYYKSRKIMRAFYGENNNDAVILAYKLSLKYLMIAGIYVNKNVSDMQAYDILKAKMIMKGYNNVSNDLYILMDMVLYIKMGGHTINKNDKVTAAESFGHIRGAVFAKAHTIKKYIIKLIETFF